MTIKPELTRQTIRQSIRTKRRSLTTDFQQNASLQILQQLCAQPKIQTASSIALYLANDGELDLMPFVQWCWQQKKTVYLPVIHPFSAGHLLFLKYSEETSMTSNCYGIAEPKLDVRYITHINNIDVLCTPLVAFDLCGNRLGMGGGFYDRTLENWYNKSQSGNDEIEQIKPFPIGVAHECQEVEQIPFEHWDIPLPKIITPSKVISLKHHLFNHNKTSLLFK